MKFKVGEKISIYSSYAEAREGVVASINSTRRIILQGEDPQWSGWHPKQCRRLKPRATGWWVRVFDDGTIDNYEGNPRLDRKMLRTVKVRAESKRRIER